MVLTAIPSHFEIEPEIREQLSAHPGHQRCVEGGEEVLLVLHDVPEPLVPTRQTWYFWRRYDGRWTQSAGPGLTELGELLGRYEAAVEAHVGGIGEIRSARDVLEIVRHSGPLAESIRGLTAAIDQALKIEPEDRVIRAYRDRARHVEHAAALLDADARLTMEFLRTEQGERLAGATERAVRGVNRLTLLAALFLPVITLAVLIGVASLVALPLQISLWVAFVAAALGALLLFTRTLRSGQRLTPRALLAGFRERGKLPEK